MLNLIFHKAKLYLHANILWAILYLEYLILASLVKSIWLCVYTIAFRDRTLVEWTTWMAKSTSITFYNKLCFSKNSWNKEPNCRYFSHAIAKCRHYTAYWAYLLEHKNRGICLLYSFAFTRYPEAYIVLAITFIGWDFIYMLKTS